MELLLFTLNEISVAIFKIVKIRRYFPLMSTMLQMQGCLNGIPIQDAVGLVARCLFNVPFDVITGTLCRVPVINA